MSYTYVVAGHYQYKFPVYLSSLFIFISQTSSSGTRRGDSPLSIAQLSITIHLQFLRVFTGTNSLITSKTWINELDSRRRSSCVTPQQLLPSCRFFAQGFV